ncbi:MAG: hypothetical protein QOF55_38 [Thermoleophilaceae bacterium]|nr:hypothetical protein [Thermoleophilaceae bacterium]
MLRSRTFALLAAISMLALPGTALAQSAGDDQYQDPLAGQHGGSGGGSGSAPSSHTPATPSAPSAPSTPAAAAPTSTGTQASAPQASAAQTTPGQLPRTGFDVVLTVELGLALLLTGIVSQRMLARRERREQR